MYYYKGIFNTGWIRYGFPAENLLNEIRSILL